MICSWIMNIIHFPVRRCRSSSSLLSFVRIVYTRDIPSHVIPEYVTTVCIWTKKHPTKHPLLIYNTHVVCKLFIMRKLRRKPFIVEHAIALSLQNRFAFSVWSGHILQPHRAVYKLDFEIGKYNIHKHIHPFLFIWFLRCARINLAVLFLSNCNLG